MCQHLLYTSAVSKIDVSRWNNWVLVREVCSAVDFPCLTCWDMTLSDFSRGPCLSREVELMSSSAPFQPEPFRHSCLHSTGKHAYVKKQTNKKKNPTWFWSKCANLPLESQASLGWKGLGKLILLPTPERVGTPFTTSGWSHHFLEFLGSLGYFKIIGIQIPEVKWKCFRVVFRQEGQYRNGVYLGS